MFFITLEFMVVYILCSTYICIELYNGALGQWNNTALMGHRGVFNV